MQIVYGRKPLQLQGLLVIHVNTCNSCKYYHYCMCSPCNAWKSSHVAIETIKTDSTRVHTIPLLTTRVVTSVAVQMEEFKTTGCISRIPCPSR